MDNKAMDEIEDLTQKYWHEYFEEIDWNDTVELYETKLQKLYFSK